MIASPVGMCSVIPPEDLLTCQDAPLDALGAGCGRCDGHLQREWVELLGFPDAFNRAEHTGGNEREAMSTREPQTKTSASQARLLLEDALLRNKGNRHLVPVEKCGRLGSGGPDGAGTALAIARHQSGGRSEPAICVESKILPGL